VGRRSLEWATVRGVWLAGNHADETKLVRFRQRLREYYLHENLLTLVNHQLQAKRLVLKTCTLVDAIANSD
jgi:hypothetical protein